jgi:thiol-disulfide isomerase/thioredoxin/Tfp pilus assembly protein PilF
MAGLRAQCILFSISILVTSFLAPSLCLANESMGTPAARAEFEKGWAAQLSGDFSSAAEAYKRAINIDPDFAKAHENYIFTSQLAVSKQLQNEAKNHSSDDSKGQEERERHAGIKVHEKLQFEYEELCRQHPDKAVYQWALGFLNLETDPRAAERFAGSALKIDSTFAPAFNILSIIDGARGDTAAGREDLRKAVEANPQNPEYLFNYAYELRDVNPQECVRLLTHLLEQFPDSESASLTLYVLSDQAGTPEEKIRYLELLKAKFPPSKSEFSEGGMMRLFSLYDQQNREKALALAEEMKQAKPKEEDWGLSAKYEEQMIAAEKLLASGNPKGAIELLSRVQLPSFFDHAGLDMLRARAEEKSGNVEKAYADLTKIFATEPTDDLQSAITRLGEKLRKTPKEIDTDVVRIRDANAKPASEFTLPGYGSRKQVSLSEFKGRVVLLNFWFPECGPCHEEFPYLKAVLEKYKGQGLAVIAVNIVPEQNDLVLSSLKGYGLDFTPAQDDKKVSAVYGVGGVPANYLIGVDGRVWFHPPLPITDLSKQRILERQIESLLHLTNSKLNGEK